MIGLRGFTISIGCSKFLEITLVKNMRHFEECLVITSPEDERSQAVAASVPGVELFITDAATRHGAYFNKGLCFEEAWDHWGRRGWFCVFDADIIMPDHVPLDWLKPDTLYGARRRILADPSKYHPGLDWRSLPPHHDGGPVGFLQIFNADAADLRDRKTWYDVSFPHAGGGDEYFMYLFTPQHRSILGIDCLHLGKPCTNWFGLDEHKRKMMARFMHHYIWTTGMRWSGPDGGDWKDGEIVERVQPPGYEPSTHELRFVDQWRKRQKR